MRSSSSDALKVRLRAAGIHLCMSMLVAAIGASIVFLVWYPPPFADIAGGLFLFGLLTSIDVIIGPMLTAVVFNPRKPRGELARDVSVIAVLQLAALAYGLHAIFEARPVLLSFEVDRFRVVAAAEVQVDELSAAPPGLQDISLTGPRLIAAVKPTTADDLMRSIDLGLQGIDLSMIPKYWRPYEDQKAAVLKAARPVSALLARYPAASSELSAIAAKAGRKSDELRFLPVTSRRASWTIVLDPTTAAPLGYLPIDGFVPA